MTCSFLFKVWILLTWTLTTRKKKSLEKKRVAYHKTFKSLSQALRVHAKNVDENYTRALRRTALVGDSSLVYSTPVDLGRARSSWSASIGVAAPSDTGLTESIGGDLAAGVALSQARPVITNWRPNLGGSLFLSNSVDYIIPLDNGSSAQAPTGMTLQAMEAMRGILRGVRLLRSER
jgi:hypothetical protein